MKQSTVVTKLEEQRRAADIQKLNASLAAAVKRKKQLAKRAFNSPAVDEE